MLTYAAEDASRVGQVFRICTAAAVVDQEFNTIRNLSGIMVNMSFYSSITNLHLFASRIAIAPKRHFQI